ncbi:hypothetical protein V6N13_073130 [Hibiscus sabdariffa]|uniref:Uncharacterized protein n=1 Tax=Hibiscus sabdariffa TaxID=183260 RepID=A0ABR2E856_9ROSI
MILCKPHKTNDVSTIQAFMKSWEVFSCGSDDEILHPGQLDLEASSRIFLPIELMPNVKNILLNDGMRKMTRSFEFDVEMIAMLMFKAKSKSLEHPSQVLALSAFV